MNKCANIYEFVQREEAAFVTGIAINGWQWGLKQHLKTSFYYKHGRLLNGNDEDTPVKNITRPLLNLQYRTEDLDIKDITLYVDDPQAEHLSFLVKEYHNNVFAVENNLDEWLDDTNESKVDYGAGLNKKGANAKPETIDLQSIAFCDQTNMMKGPIAFKHFFNPAELKDMESVGWGNPENGATATVDDLIQFAETYKVNDKQDGQQNQTPGNYIEIYEVHGVLPQSYLDDSDNEYKYTRQMQIIGFYKDKNGMKQGLTLFRKKLAKSMLKVHLRDKIFSRAVGYGGAEELFESQVWTNYNEIRTKEMLDAGAKVVLKAIGAQLKARYPNGLKNVDHLEIIELNEGEDIAQIDTTPRTMALFEKWNMGWEEHALKMASASETSLGKRPASGTPFRLEGIALDQAVGAESIHDYRRGKFAKYVEEVYRDWIIPHIVEKITEGTRFLSELSTEDMQYVIDKVTDNQVSKFEYDEVYSGRIITKEGRETMKQEMKLKLLKGGNKKFLEVLKGDFKKKTLKVKINVANKQKDLAQFTDKMVNLFRQILANPQGFQQMMQMPEMAKTFNSILESSGLSPVMYAGLSKPMEQPMLPSPQPTEVAPEPAMV